MRAKFTVEDKPLLNNLYCIEQLSSVEIAKQLKVSITTVLNTLMRFGIPRRNFEETGRLFWQKHNRKSFAVARAGEGNPFFGKHHNEETKHIMGEKVSPKMKIKWEDQAYRDRVIRSQINGRGICPNKKERILINILKQVKFPFKFTGDGSFIIGGYIPDFVNYNGKKQIIELFGDYWHNMDRVLWHRTELGRMMAFSRFGYKTLIIWEHELKEPNKVISRIRQFMKN